MLEDDPQHRRHRRHHEEGEEETEEDGPPPQGQGHQDCRHRGVYGEPLAAQPPEEPGIGRLPRRPPFAETGAAGGGLEPTPVRHAEADHAEAGEPLPASVEILLVGFGVQLGADMPVMIEMVERIRRPTVEDGQLEQDADRIPQPMPSYPAVHEQVMDRVGQELEEESLRDEAGDPGHPEGEAAQREHQGPEQPGKAERDEPVQEGVLAVEAGDRGRADLPGDRATGNGEVPLYCLTHGGC